MTNAIFLKSFWHLKVTQPFTCFSVNQVYMFLRQSNIFISSPHWIFISSLVGFVVSLVGFVISRVENLLLGLTPEKFWKFGIFPGESSSPYRGTETGCIQLLRSNSREHSTSKRSTYYPILCHHHKFTANTNCEIYRISTIRRKKSLIWTIAGNWKQGFE